MKEMLKNGLFYVFFMAAGLGITAVCLPSENPYPKNFPVIKKSQYTVCYDGRAKNPL